MYRRPRQPRRDRIHSDAMRAKLARHRPGESDNAGLARHVVDEARHHRTERARRHVDDAAPAALLHARDEGLRHQKATVEIDREHAPPVFERHVVEGALRIDAGAVDEDVASAEFLLHVGGHSRDRFWRDHITLTCQRLGTAGRFDHLHGVRAGRNVGDGDVHAILGQTFRKGLADAVDPPVMTATLSLWPLAMAMLPM